MQVGNPPDWYPDPYAPGWQRWWNGLEWEGAPVPAVPVPAPLPPPFSQPQNQPFLGRKEWTWIGGAAAAVFLLMIIGAAATGGRLPASVTSTTTSAKSAGTTSLPASAPTTEAALPPAAAAPAGPHPFAVQIQTSLDSGFAGTSWYPFITGVVVDGDMIRVDTSLYPDSDATDPGRKICQAVSGMILKNTYGIDGVRVYGSTGSRLSARRISLGDKC